MEQKHELRAERFSTREAVRIEIYGKRTTLYCRMTNLSKTGAKFQIISATYNPKVGEFLRVIVQLKTVNSVRVLNAEIIWVKGYEMGVAFLKQEELLKKVFR